MSAKDYIPFITLGFFITPIVFALLLILRSPEIMALILILASVILSVLISRQKGIKFVLTSSLIVLLIPFTLSLFILGLALMTEQHIILEIGKIENGTDCVYIPEYEMKKYPTLKKAVETANKEGKVKVSISSSEWKAIKSLTHGRCIIYKGEFYGFGVMMT